MKHFEMKACSWLSLVSLLFVSMRHPFPFVSAYLSSHNPPWSPTYDMLESLISMQCNHSGFSSPTRGAEFGIISYDWSNAKALWAQTKPMSCEELLIDQVEKTNAVSGRSRIFIYRNIVKALPWFSTVRSKLEDPKFEGFFLKFDGNKRPFHVPECAPENKTRCTKFYHDQEQTPQVPSPNNENPDGSCVEYCDCGLHPCGEYLFDHRNGTMLREWIINELILGPTAVGHPSVSGVFLDDYWCSNQICEATGNRTLGCPCDDPIQGPTEIDRYAKLDMNLSDQDIRDLTDEWNKTMTLLEKTLLDHKAYSWSLMAGQENANAKPFLLSSTEMECTLALNEACKTDSVWQQKTMLFGFSTNGTLLTQLSQDLAFFLLARGPFAYAGWGLWGMTW